MKPPAAKKSAAKKTTAKPVAQKDLGVDSLDIKPKTRKIKAPPRIRQTGPRKAPSKKPANSVSDKLKALSGRSYDVYQDRFIAKLRPSIRNVMLKQNKKKTFLFASFPQEYEDILFNFLHEHYNDPFMDWENSPEREKLENNGWHLESLDPIIEDCFKKL